MAFAFASLSLSSPLLDFYVEYLYLHSLGLIYTYTPSPGLVKGRHLRTAAQSSSLFPCVYCPFDDNQAIVALNIFLDSCKFVFFLPSFLPHCRSCYFTNASSLIAGCLTTLVSSCLYSLLRPVPFACAQSIRGYDLSLSLLSEPVTRLHQLGTSQK